MLLESLWLHGQRADDERIDVWKCGSIERDLEAQQPASWSLLGNEPRSRNDVELNSPLFRWLSSLVVAAEGYCEDGEGMEEGVGREVSSSDFSASD